MRKPRGLVLMVVIGWIATATAGAGLLAVAVGTAAPAGADTANVALTPAAGIVTRTVSVTIGGFGSLQSVTLHWDAIDGPTVATTTADGSGAGTTSFLAPAAPHGSHSVYAVGDGGTPTAPAVFRIQPSLTLERGSAPPGRMTIPCHSPLRHAIPSRASAPFAPATSTFPNRKSSRFSGRSPKTGNCG